MSAKKGVHYTRHSNELKFANEQKSMNIELSIISYASTNKNDLFFDCKISSTGPDSYIGSYNINKITIRDEFILPDSRKTISHEFKKLCPWNTESDGSGISFKIANSYIEFIFHGTNVYLIGSYRTDLGKIKVTIDLQEIDINKPNHPNTIIFTSGTLGNTNHKLRVDVVDSKNVVIEGLYYMNNNGFRMYEFKQIQYKVAKQGQRSIFCCCQ